MLPATNDEIVDIIRNGKGRSVVLTIRAKNGPSTRSGKIWRVQKNGFILQTEPAPKNFGKGRLHRPSTIKIHFSAVQDVSLT